MDIKYPGEVPFSMEDTRPDHQVYRNGHDVPVVGLDVDGTLGDYHGHFLKFAEGWLGRSMPSAEDINPGLRLSDFMGIPHEQYRQIKLAYRQGGLKRTMPVYEGATDLTHELVKAGVEIWICTTRPYNRLDNIDPDTREWLNRHRIAYSHILFDDPDSTVERPLGKYGALVQQVGVSRIVAVVDDLPDQLQSARSYGISKRYLRAQPYNLQGSDLTGMRRLPGIGSIHFNLMIDLKEWMAAK